MSQALLRFSIEPCLSGLVRFTLLSDGEVFPGVASRRHFQQPHVGRVSHEGNTSGAEKADGLDEAIHVLIVVAFVELLQADLLLWSEEVEYFDQA